MKATVTGASGHIGASLVRHLLERGWSVRALIRRDSRALEGMDVEMVEGDLRDPEALKRIFDGSEIVFHAAGQISIGRAGKTALYETNVIGTRNVIAALRAGSARRLVHFSSIEALDPDPLQTPIDEERALCDGDARARYSSSKAEGERAVRDAIADGLDALIVYPTAVIGPFDFKPSLLGRALIAFAEGAIPAIIPGGFDWVDVRDVAAGALSAAERGRPGSRYILGGYWASMGDLVAAVCGAAGVRAPRIVCPMALAKAWAPFSTAFSRLIGEEPLFTSYTLDTLEGNRSVSHSRAQRELGYSPRSLDETVRDTIRWFTENGKIRRRAVR